jgi:hypothetical protein
MFHLMIEANEQEVGQESACDIAGGPDLLFKERDVRIPRDRGHSLVIRREACGQLDARRDVNQQ